MYDTKSDKTIKEVKIKGISISSGKIAGQVCLYSAENHKRIPEYSLLTNEAVDFEIGRFEDVLVKCSHELNRIASEVADAVGKAEAEIFLTQKHIMNDPKVLASIKQTVIEDRKNIEWAISEVFGKYEEKFASLDNEYLRERASDVGEIKRRLLSKILNSKNGFICQGQKHCVQGADRIVVAEELTSDMIIHMNLDKVLGFVTERGGITSHAAIIARSLGIPSVSGVTGIMKYAQCGDTLLIDGDGGYVYLHPEETTTASLIPVEQVDKDAICVLSTPAGMEALANASSIEDIRQARNVGADGIGLLRTEMLFIKEERVLTEEEQYVFYHHAADEMQGKPVTFRMLDVGGDKPFPFLKLKKEANPFLGWRGARFLLGNPQIFNPQIRALGLVSRECKIRILFPMIIDFEQTKELILRAKQVLADSRANLDNIQFGAMFEVPSAFLQAKRIFELIDFGSIGSNDLIQYLFAVDRSNELVSQDYDPDHPVLWDLLSSLSEIAEKSRKPLSICGEIAGREGMTAKLLGVGIKSLSVAPRLVPRVRNEMAGYHGILA